MNSRRDKHILNAYRLLFSMESSSNIDFIKSLNVNKIKSAFRARALETHPDRAKLLGINQKILTRRFNEISDAYRDLYEFIKHTKGPSAGSGSGYGKRSSYSSGCGPAYSYSGGRTYGNNHDKNRGPGEKSGSRRRREEDNNTSEAKHGSAWRHKRKKNPAIPKNFKLLFGQYLFFAGHISFASLLDAIFWQRKQRDLYGKIAVNWGIIGKEDILPILKSRKRLEKFGECAMRLGYINRFQHKAVLYKQAKMQKQLGEYFVKEGIITRDELRDILFEYENFYKRN